jgi:16S rRNA (uracil1498-N3)-methyltransferase
VIGHFFVAPERVEAGAIAWLDDDDTHHLVTVLRVRPGAAVSIADGTGTVWEGRFDGLHDGSARIALVRSERVEPEVPTITVVHALPKQRKLDDVIQRLSEVGVARVVPVHSARSQVQLGGPRAAKALARWRAVALAAAKQSRRPRVMEIAPVGDWPTAFANGLPGVVCWEDSTVGLRAALESVGEARQIVVAVGPEGGLTPHEVDSCGLARGSLGRTILRTETAALVAVSAVRYHHNLMEAP